MKRKRRPEGRLFTVRLLHSSCHRKRKLEMPPNDAAYRNIFVQFFPAQCSAICPQRNLLELFFACVAQQFETGGGETYLAAIREFDENDATRHPDAGVLCTSHPRRFEGRVQIQVVAVIEEIFTQGGNVNVSTNTHCYDDGKHGCAGVWCWVGVGLEDRKSTRLNSSH